MVSYFASASPDGLDSATLQGCRVVQTAQGEELTGSCIAQHATEHAMTVSPLAEYTVFGHPGTVGLAGIAGAVVVLAFAGGVFWLLAAAVVRGAERVGAGHSHPLYRDGDSVVRRAPAEVKIVALVVFVLAVVATPREMVWPFAAYAGIVLVVWRVARIPLRWILPRMLIEAPFIVLAVLLPFTEGGQQVEIAGVHLSVGGLWAAWGIVVKGTLGVAGSLTIAATTSARELPLALSRLGMPGLVTSMLVLMIRYIDLLSAEAAECGWQGSPAATRRAHCIRPAAIAKGLGALFLRSYERGERVYLAMTSRGFDGRVPELAIVGAGPRATPAQWVAALTPGVAAVLVAGSAWAPR